jgi:hypothetical protein
MDEEKSSTLKLTSAPHKEGKQYSKPYFRSEIIADGQL